MYMPGSVAPSSRNLEKTGSMAASVFPDPVGAMIKTLRPSSTSGMASLWGSVGSLNPLSARAALIASCNAAKATTRGLPAK